MSLEYYLNHPSNPDVCDIFKAGAKDTWARIYFSRKTPRLKIHETSISQNLVYEMNLLKHKFPSLDFNLYESTDEKSNGDDLELSVQHSDGSVVTYAIQSKILYHRRNKKAGVNLIDGYYGKLKHWVGKGARRQKQVDLLINYAAARDYIPIYLFYNYVNRGFGSGVDESLYGCTVISAQYLKDFYTAPDGNLRNNVKFSELHIGRAFPWHELICSLPKLSKTEISQKLMIQPNRIPIIFNNRSLELSGNWIPLETNTPPVIDIDKATLAISDFDSFDVEKIEEDQIPRVFNPKFKLLIGIDSNYKK